MDNDVVTQTQPHLPALLHAGALPLAPPLPTLPANRTTSNTDDSIGSDHATMDVEPRDGISAFLLHVRRAADDAASSAQDVNVQRKWRHFGVLVLAAREKLTKRHFFL